MSFESQIIFNNAMKSLTTMCTTGNPQAAQNVYTSYSRLPDDLRDQLANNIATSTGMSLEAVNTVAAAYAAPAPGKSA